MSREKKIAYFGLGELGLMEIEDVFIDHFIGAGFEVPLVLDVELDCGRVIEDVAIEEVFHYSVVRAFNVLASNVEKLEDLDEESIGKLIYDVAMDIRKKRSHKKIDELIKGLTNE